MNARIKTPKTGPKLVELLDEHLNIKDHTHRVFATRRRGTTIFNIAISETNEFDGIPHMDHYIKKLNRIKGIADIRNHGGYISRHDGRTVFGSITLELESEISFTKPDGQKAASEFGDLSQPLVIPHYYDPAGNNTMALGFPVPRAIIPYEAQPQYSSSASSTATITQADTPTQRGVTDVNETTTYPNKRATVLRSVAETYRKARRSPAISDQLEFDAALDDLMDAGYGLRDLRRIINNRGGRYA